MKKGFTLIELLAVIVILAIIALIATPTILGVVENARKGAAESSALGYIDAVEKQKAINLMNDDDSDDLEQDIYNLPLNQYKVKVKGKMPDAGWIEVLKTGVGRYSLKIGDYVVSYDGTDKTVVKNGTLASSPKVYPEYVYFNKYTATLIGYPIDVTTIDNMFVASIDDLSLGFQTQDECTGYATSLGMNASVCSKKSFTTPDLEYLTQPNPAWPSYFRIKLSNIGKITGIDVCSKNKVCIPSTIINQDKATIKQQLETLFPTYNVYEQENGRIAAVSDVDNTWIEVGTQNSVSYADYNQKISCAVVSNSMIGCEHVTQP